MLHTISYWTFVQTISKSAGNWYSWGHCNQCHSPQRRSTYDDLRCRHRHQGSQGGHPSIDHWPTDESWSLTGHQLINSCLRWPSRNSNVDATTITSRRQSIVTIEEHMTKTMSSLAILPNFQVRYLYLICRFYSFPPPSFQFALLEYSNCISPAICSLIISFKHQRSTLIIYDNKKKQQ